MLVTISWLVTKVQYIPRHSKVEVELDIGFSAPCLTLPDILSTQTRNAAKAHPTARVPEIQQAQETPITRSAQLDVT